MSISHSKINELIERVVNDVLETSYDRDSLIELCRRIYLIETSIYDRSAQQINNDIRDEIKMRAHNIKGDKE